MSGHSKWSSIKHQKGVADQRRSSLFTKIANTISVAARSGGDPTMNFQLRLAMDKARSANMPRDRIERAIKRGTGELGGAQIEESLFEIYGPSGTAILVEVISDNKNRASAEIKAVLNKHGGKLAGSGSVAYLFARQGEIRIKNKAVPASLRLRDRSDLRSRQELRIKENVEIEEVIINSGAEDYQGIPDGFLVYTKPEELNLVANNLKQAGLTCEGLTLVYKPETTVDLPDEESAKVMKLLHALDELDDVASVSSNLG